MCALGHTENFSARLNYTVQATPQVHASRFHCAAGAHGLVTRRLFSTIGISLNATLETGVLARALPQMIWVACGKPKATLTRRPTCATTATAPPHTHHARAACNGSGLRCMVSRNESEIFQMPEEATRGVRHRHLVQRGQGSACSSRCHLLAPIIW